MCHVLVQVIQRTETLGTRKTQVQPQGNKTSLYREGSRQSNGNRFPLPPSICAKKVQKSGSLPRLFQVEAEVSGRVSKHKEKTKISWHLGQSEKNLQVLEVTFEMQSCFSFFLPSFPPHVLLHLCFSLSLRKYYKS